ncbi:VOC family protein [Fictibacillus fluitans]|uniref:VOC family protein n=1 Tax=Fictibacillus fluitans TaxID=3058422 RepID=A0ABT8HYW5_9BACL|nr:VOC family protein [Fictibacillus sp. NE201]MDN4525976.1 VOC family protein [Fictibacillus sp. NE201]
MNREGSNLIPMLAVDHGEKAIEFYKKVFGAHESNKMVNDMGKIEHCELEFKGTRIMVADEFPGHNHAAKSLGGTPVILYVKMENVEVLVDKAVNSGAVILRPIQELPNGERIGKIQDPFGHVWMLASQQ